MCDEQVNTLSFGEFIYLSNSKFSTMKECKKREVFKFFFDCWVCGGDLLRKQSAQYAFQCFSRCTKVYYEVFYLISEIIKNNNNNNK